MGERVNNMSKMMNNPKQRNLYLSLVVLAVLALVGGFWFVGNNAASVQAPTGTNLAATPQINNVPGSSTSPQYNKEVDEQNKQIAAQALSSGGSFVPTPVNNAVSGTSPMSDIERANQEGRAAEDRERARLEAERLRQEEEERARQAALQQLQQASAPVAVPVVQVQEPKRAEKYSVDDVELISTLLSSWNTKASKAEFDFAGQKQQNTGGSQNSAMMQSNQGVQAAGTQNVVAKSLAPSGTIYNAILETSINSDEPSPVIAKIVSGPLAGARLIGGMQRTGEKVLVEFGTISLPNAKSSMKIRAVAIDPKSTRTALADDVDRHYFLRYGVLLASAFLGGYSDAIARQNTTTTVTPDGNVVQTTGEISSKDINRQAIGSVGKELAEQTKQQIQGLQPTITVNSGSAIGILLMDDLVEQNR